MAEKKQQQKITENQEGYKSRKTTVSFPGDVCLMLDDLKGVIGTSHTMVIIRSIQHMHYLKFPPSKVELNKELKHVKKLVDTPQKPKKRRARKKKEVEELPSEPIKAEVKVKEEIVKIEPIKDEKEEMLKKEKILQLEAEMEQEDEELKRKNANQELDDLLSDL